MLHFLIFKTVLHLKHYGTLAEIVSHQSLGIKNKWAYIIVCHLLSSLWFNLFIKVIHCYFLLKMDIHSRKYMGLFCSLFCINVTFFISIYQVSILIIIPKSTSHIVNTLFISPNDVIHFCIDFQICFTSYSRTVQVILCLSCHSHTPVHPLFSINTDDKYS